MCFPNKLLMMKKRNEKQVVRSMYKIKKMFTSNIPKYTFPPGMPISNFTSKLQTTGKIINLNK